MKKLIDIIKINFQNKSFVIAGLFFLCLFYFFGFSGFVIAAWEQPTAAPTGGNVDAPINVSSANQWKVGGLAVGSTSENTTYKLYSAGSLGVVGASDLQGTLKVTGAADLQSTLTVQNAASFQSTISVKGEATFNGGLRAYSGTSTRLWVYNGDNTSPGKVFINNAPADPKAINASLVVGGRSGGVSIYAGSGSSYGVYSNGVIGLYSRGSTSYGIYAATSATGSSAIYGLGGNSRGVMASGGNASYAGIEASHTQVGTSFGKSIAIRAQGASSSASPSGDQYSYGVYGVGGNTSGTAAGTRKTYAIYGQAGNLSSGTADTVTYGVYGDDGTYTQGYSYAGYFDGTTQMCRGSNYCAAFAANNMSAIFSKGPVYVTPSSAIQGNAVINTTGLRNEELPGRGKEEHATRINGGLYLSSDGNQATGSILMHDQLKPDWIYRIEIVAGEVRTALVSRCQEGLACRNDNTVIERGWDGNYLGGCRVIRDVERCNQNTNGNTKCLNGKCVTECEAKGYFCDRSTSPLCGAVISGNGYSCGSGNSLSCCTGN